MPLFDDIVIRFGGDDSRLQRVAKRVQGLGNKLAGSFGGLGDVLASVGRGGLVAGVTALAAAFGVAARKSLDFADSLTLTADKVDVSVEGLQELRYWAEQYGVSQGTLDTALQRFSRRLGEAAQGVGTLLPELQRYNIAIRDAEGRTRRTEDVLRDYAEAVRRAGSGTEQLRLTVAGFDTEAAGLVNALARGKEGMDAAAESARELGIILEEDLVRQGAELETEWNLLMTRLDLLWKKFILGVAEGLDDLTGTRRTVTEIQEKIEENNRKIAEAERGLNDQRRMNAAVLEQVIKGLKAENEELEKALRLKQQNTKATNDLTQAEAGLTAEQGKSRSSSKSEDFRKKTPEEIAEALALFRAGLISQEELGERAGLQPPGTARSTERGAFGTKENRGQGAFFDGMPTVVVGPDREALNQFFEAFFAGHVYEVRVVPKIDDGIEAEEGFVGSEQGGLPEAATQLGIRQ